MPAHRHDLAQPQQRTYTAARRSRSCKSQEMTQRRPAGAANAARPRLPLLGNSILLCAEGVLRSPQCQSLHAAPIPPRWLALHLSESNNTMPGLAAGLTAAHRPPPPQASWRGGAGRPPAGGKHVWQSSRLASTPKRQPASQSARPMPMQPATQFTQQHPACAAGKPERTIYRAQATLFNKGPTCMIVLASGPPEGTHACAGSMPFSSAMTRARVRSAATLVGPAEPCGRAGVGTGRQSARVRPGGRVGALD